MRESEFAFLRFPSGYAIWIDRAAAFCGLSHVGWTHSPRAGRASDLTLANRPFIRNRELGRWQCDRTLRQYLVIIGVAGGELAKRPKPYLPHVQNIERAFTEHFLLWQVRDWAATRIGSGRGPKHAPIQ